MKCDNCNRDAVYLIERKNANTIHLCAYDLPERLKADALAGKFKFPEEPAKKKKAVAVDPEPVVEAPVEVPVEPVSESN